jgi:hypothetical protein
MRDEPVFASGAWHRVVLARDPVLDGYLFAAEAERAEAAPVQVEEVGVSHVFGGGRMMVPAGSTTHSHGGTAPPCTKTPTNSLTGCSPGIAPTRSHAWLRPPLRPLGLRGQAGRWKLSRLWWVCP